VIFLDYNAGAPLLAEAAAALTLALSAPGSNPSSVHQAGRAARNRLTHAREHVARSLGCEPREVIFTGSGSEGAALAIRGAWNARKDRSRNTLVTSTLEHPCVLGAVGQLEAQGVRVIRLSPDPAGLVPLPTVLAALTADVALCSLIWVNNETGVIQPVAEVSRACLAQGIAFHTDAVQAVGRIPATLREVPADLFSFSGHKLGAPPGIGVLLARRTVPLEPMVPGHQEDGRRGGTQSLAMIEALVAALTVSTLDVEAEGARLTGLRERFEAGIVGAVVNGAGSVRAPGTSNLRFPGIDGEALLIALDLEGICCSAGAACASGSMTPSHVLTAMGLSSTQAQESLRFSFGRGTTQAEIDRAIEAINRLVPRAKREDG
jgi:cysteine desulfurase